jgi:hypothetical protein
MGEDLRSGKFSAVVHIGPHKTASTSIQIGLSKIQEIMEANGYQLPPISLTDRPSGPQGTVGLNYFAMELMNCNSHPWMGWKIPNRKLQTQTWLESCHGIPILSAEEFSKFDAFQITYLASLLPPNSLCLIFARSYDSLSESLWGQLVFSGVETRSLSEFQSHFLQSFKSESPLRITDRSKADLSRMRLPHLVGLWRTNFQVNVLMPDFSGEVPNSSPLQVMLQTLNIESFNSNDEINTKYKMALNLKSNSRIHPEKIIRLLNLNRTVGISEPYRWANLRRQIRFSGDGEEVFNPSNFASDLSPNIYACESLRDLYKEDLHDLEIFLKL